MREPSLLIVGEGEVARRVLQLLGRSATVTAVGVEQLSDVAGFHAAGLVTNRPYPTIATALYERCWMAGVPCCEATLVAHEFRVGPAVVAGTTPCHECFQRRLRSQARDLAAHDLLANLGRQTKGCWFQGELDALNEQVAAIFAAELLALATNTYPHPGDGLGRFWEGDAIYGELTGRVFSRVGRCARCAQPTGCQQDHLSDFLVTR
jgi:hypothetical protein